MIKGMAMGKWYMLPKISIRVNGKMIKSKVKVLWIGSMRMRNMLGNGKMISLMDMVNIIGCRIRLSIKYLRILIKGIGRKDKGKDLRHFSIPMDVDFKGIL